MSTVSKGCSVALIPLEFYLTRPEAFEGLPLIPASQLHRPDVCNQSVLRKGLLSSFQHGLTGTSIRSITPEKTKVKYGVKRKRGAHTEEVPQSELQVYRGTKKVPARNASCLPKQVEVHKKLADISNLPGSDRVKSLLGTKNEKFVSGACKHGGKNGVAKGKSSFTKPHETGIGGQEQKKLPKANKIRQSRVSRRKSHSEHDTNFSENDSPSEGGTQRKDGENYDNIEQGIPAKRRKQIETLVTTEYEKDVPRRSGRARKETCKFDNSDTTEYQKDMPWRSGRARKQIYKLDYSDTSLLESVKKAKTSRKVFPNNPKEQGAGAIRDRNIDRDDEDRTQTEKMPEPTLKQPARKALATKKVKEDMKIMNDEDRESQILRENTQGKSEHVEVRKVNRTRRPKKIREDIQDESEHEEVKKGNRTRGRPNQNQELTKDITSVPLNMALRRSTRQHKVNYSYLDDSYAFEESLSFFNENKKQEKKRGKKNVVTNGKAAKSNVRSIFQNEYSEKSTGNKSKELEEKFKVKKAQLGSENCDSLLKSRNARYEEDKGNDVGSRGEENISRKGEEKQCKESESIGKAKVTSKKVGHKSGEQNKTSKKPEKPQAEESQRSEDCKITAKKGTLKYLHQREKYIAALAKEVGGDDDFDENPFLAKKKFKFTNLLPPSHEDTLVIKTPKRRSNEDQENAVITPRTTMLGQLQPVTPYSPCPSLDSDTKKDALKQVYMWMKNKGQQPKRSRKVLHDTSRQNIHFTPLELPSAPENQSDNESDATDEYFGDCDPL